jgi:hypothetical protein
MSDPLSALRAVTGQEPSTTTNDFPNIPSVPPVSKPAEANFLSSVKAWIEKAVGAGGFASYKDLARYGLIEQTLDGTYGPVRPASQIIPPVPTNVIASGAMTNILVEWDDPAAAYGNHSHAEIWAAETDNFTLAVLVGESSGFTFAHSVGPASTRYYWVRFVSTSDKEGPYQSVGGVLGETADDPAYLLSVLNNQITEAQLYTDLNTRIDLIDTAGPADLPNGLIAKVRAQQGDMTQIGNDVDTIGNSLLEAALKIQDNTDLLYDAGVTVTPGTGEVYIYAVREAENRLDDAEIRLDAAEASITLKASSTYVDEQIALAVLDPSQIADLSGVNARLATAEADIDGLNAAVVLKASLVTVDSQGVRLSTAESDIDALQSEIVNKVANTTFDAADVRLTTAESRITAYDNAGIINTVSDVRQLQNEAEDDAETLLRSILIGDYTLNESRAAVALARNELTAYVDDGLNAEAQARLELATAVDGNAAAILSEQTARTNADSAMATDITNLGVSVNNNTAALLVEQTARADADSALTSSIAAMGSTVAGNTAAILAESTTRANADSAMASDISTLNASVAANTAAISTESTTRATADSAMASSITTLQTTVGEHTTAIEVSADAIDGISATYTVKIDNNGVMGGYGLMSSLAEGGAATSKFIASVDQFAVVAPGRTAGQLNSVPLAVLTTAQTINGVAFAPGVYIDGASVNAGTIGNAQMGVASVDTLNVVDASINNAKISDLNASKINAGYISAERLAANSINADRLVAGTITSDKIAAGTIAADRINAGSLYTQLFYAGDAYIGNLSVNTIKIADGAITSFAGWTTPVLGPYNHYNIYVGFIPYGSSFLVSISAWSGAGAWGADLSLAQDINGIPYPTAGQLFSYNTTGQPFSDGTSMSRWMNYITVVGLGASMQANVYVTYWKK